jgi:hypothetical protein
MHVFVFRIANLRFSSKVERKKILPDLQNWVGSAAGLPDGFFSDQKSKFGYILEDLGMENVVRSFGIFYDHWVYFIGILIILLVVICYNFPPMVKLYQEKSGNPDLRKKPPPTT